MSQIEGESRSTGHRRRAGWVMGSVVVAAALGGAVTVGVLRGEAPDADEAREPGYEVVASTGGGGRSSSSFARSTPEEGQRVFRYETFGNESFWTDTLRLHEVIQQGIDPSTALKVGLKVDAGALPPGLLAQSDLTDPATTVALLKLNAILGLRASVDAKDRITSLGITCALCHSTVDNSVQPGIGRRMDGWPNRDLDVGAVIALSPVLPAAKKEAYTSWGPGFYDPRYNIDGMSTPIVIPPAYGLAEVRNETYTAEGPISYWNAYVAITQMHGRGNFSDPRLGIEVSHTPDFVTPLLPGLREYQHTLLAPPPPPGSFDRAVANRGRALFEANCARCHVGRSGTDNNTGALHEPSETGMDGAYAARTANKAYRATPLRGLWQHPPYFHDGSAATLDDVVTHYNEVFRLNLTDTQRAELAEFLRTL